MPPPLRRIGIDVGGTNTDAVLLADGAVEHAVKTPTTEDVTTGIVTALGELSAFPGVARGAIDAVVIGTTHFVNAAVQRQGLGRVAAVRIGLPAAASLPPFCDWPADLAELVRGDVFMLEGGHDYDGRPIVPFDEDGMRRASRAIRESGIKAVAVAAIFSPVDPSCEERAAAILAEECPDAAVTLSRDLGRIGLLERENAALLNAALIDLARRTVAGFGAALAASGIEAPLYLTQNDGTVMEATAATALPVMTFASGPTNSMRGAAFLSGLADAIVVDVGGTSTDIGQLRRGFPREANSVVEVGGVRTLFRMPDLLSIGLGGGSLVTRDPLWVGRQEHRPSADARGAGLWRRRADCDRCCGGRRHRRHRRPPPGRGSAAGIRAGGAGGGARADRRRGRPHQDRGRRFAADRGRRRRVLGARPARRHRAGDPRAAWRARQRGRCRDRADQRRDRPDLSRPRPGWRRSPRPKRRPASARSPPAPIAKPSKPSMSKTCRSLICRATRCGCGSGWRARCAPPPAR